MKKAIMCFVALAAIAAAATGPARAQDLVINTASDWDNFASTVNNGTDNFANKTVKLNADITVTTMVGTDVNTFSGTFDGDGHTLTLNITTISADDAGAFRSINGATIRNLHTAGTVDGGDQGYAAGIVGRAIGNSTLVNCRSSVTITASKNGDGSHGGLIGNSTGTTIEGCVFDGQLVTTNNTYNCGGLVGWSQGGTIVLNCLFAPAYFTPSMATNWSSTIGRDGGNSGNNYTITNTYYTQAFGHTHQGKLARSIAGGDDVTVTNAGTATSYNVSGITAYGTGIKYGDVLYGGNGDAVSLNLTYSGSGLLDTYSADNGTLSGSANPYTLTLADANALISATLIPLYTVKMAPGTEDSTSWSFNPGEAATTGVAEGTVVNISYGGTRKVKSVVAAVVPNAPAAVTNALGWDGDLAKVTAESTVEFATAIDGMTITGTLGVDKKVSIADGATVTLDGVAINGVCGNSWAGINCVGDATITLSGENTLHLTSGTWPAIYVPQNKTVTIQGEGSLNASANYGAGIGGGYYIACGNITIAGGNITAGGGGAAGIGGGQYASCGNILISGGTVIASGDDYSAAIGGGDSGSCGTITITSGVTSVTATAGGFTSKIGAGFEGSCGTVTIEPGANVTQN